MTLVCAGTNVDGARQPLGEVNEASGYLDLIVEKVPLYLSEAGKHGNDGLSEADEQGGDVERVRNFLNCLFGVWNAKQFCRALEDVGRNLADQVVGDQADTEEREKCDVVRVRSDEISDFRTGQQREVAAGDRVTEVQLTELGCMNKGDEHGSKQKGLVLQRGPHGATPLLASAVGTESLRYDHLTVRGGIEGFGRCLLRGG